MLPVSPLTIRKINDKEWSILGRVPADSVDMIGSPVECRLADVYEYESLARLIAAAPDLLEACKGMVAAKGDSLKERWAFEDLQAAIAKADPSSPR